jgi:hypothetical protein
MPVGVLVFEDASAGVVAINLRKTTSEASKPYPF